MSTIRTVGELIDELDLYDRDLPVHLAIQPEYPFAHVSARSRAPLAIRGRSAAAAPTDRRCGSAREDSSTTSPRPQLPLWDGTDERPRSRGTGRPIRHTSSATSAADPCAARHARRGPPGHVIASGDRLRP